MATWIAGPAGVDDLARGQRLEDGVGEPQDRGQARDLRRAARGDRAADARARRGGRPEEERALADRCGPAPRRPGPGRRGGSSSGRCRGSGATGRGPAPARPGPGRPARGRWRCPGRAPRPAAGRPARSIGWITWPGTSGRPERPRPAAGRPAAASGAGVAGSGEAAGRSRGRPIRVARTSRPVARSALAGAIDLLVAAARCRDAAAMRPARPTPPEQVTGRPDRARLDLARPPDVDGAARALPGLVAAPTPGEIVGSDSVESIRVTPSFRPHRPGTSSVAATVAAEGRGDPSTSVKASRRRASPARCTATGWPSASEAAFASTTASPPSRPETTSVCLPSLRPTCDRPARRPPVGDDDAERLAAVLDDGRSWAGQGVGVLLGDDRRVGVEAGAEERRRRWAGRSRRGASASPGRATRRSG